MDRRMAAALDRHITGNYGEDQFRDEDPEEYDPVCQKCGHVFSDHPLQRFTDEDGNDYETNVCPLPEQASA